MQKSAESRLKRLQTAEADGLLRGGQVGLEKESLRVGPGGNLARTPHPRALGAPLTHPQITTDYSEALVELITPPLPNLERALDDLADLHAFIAPRLGQDILWATSMPCVVAGEASIPIAEYGKTNEARMKHIYRLGLGIRYGRVMQVISGVHFNFSLAEDLWQPLAELEGHRGDLNAFKSERYFGLIRNVQRCGWLVPYLFGASPAICRSFAGGHSDGLEDFDPSTLYLPYATSLRMSDLGYQNKKGSKVAQNISYNSVGEYIRGLDWATSTKDSEYAAMGVLVDGEYRQLNANVLQIENEYYGSIRPKQISDPDERPMLALKRRGVRYVEFRTLDVSPLDPEGVNLTQLRFLRALLVLCLVADSPPVDSAEKDANRFNLGRTAMHGRDPSFRLEREGRETKARDWGLEICEGLQSVCEVLDGDDPGKPYRNAVAEQVEALHDPARTPSARMLAEMRQTREGFYDYAMRLSQAHHSAYLKRPLSTERLALFESMVENSWGQQEVLESQPQIPFEAFLEAYFAQH